MSAFVGVVPVAELPTLALSLAQIQRMADSLRCPFCCELPAFRAGGHDEEAREPLVEHRKLGLPTIRFNSRRNDR